MSLVSQRKSARLTQVQVADMLVVNRSTVTKWETRKSLPRPALLPKIAALYGCTIDELLRDLNDERGEVESDDPPIS